MAGYVRQCVCAPLIENWKIRRRVVRGPSQIIFLVVPYSLVKNKTKTHNRRKRNNKECVFLFSQVLVFSSGISWQPCPLSHTQTDRQAQACVVIYCQEMSRSCLRSFYPDNNSKLSVGVLTFAISHAESKEPKAKNRPGGSLATTDESISLSLSLSRCDDEQMLKAKWKVDGACRSRDEVRLLNGADRHRLFHAGLTHLSLSLYVSIVTH